MYFTPGSAAGKEWRWTVLRAFADRPGKVVPERYSGGLRYPIPDSVFSAEVPAGTRFLDLDVALQQPRIVEFLVPAGGRGRWKV